MPKRSREQKSRRRAAVPERERPHAVEALDAVVAPLLVGGEHDLGVGLRPEAVAVRLELSAQLDVVVDLAVVEELQRAVLARERLAASVGQVDDREPRVAERDAGVVREPPSPSGPRCAKPGEHRPRDVAVSGGSPSATTPQMPHIRLEAPGREEHRPLRLGVVSRDRGGACAVAHLLDVPARSCRELLDTVTSPPGA